MSSIFYKISKNIVFCILLIPITSSYLKAEKNQTESTAKDSFDQSALNIFVNRELKILDDTAFLLDFLGQAINKGTITPCNKELVRQWLYRHKENIHILQKTPEDIKLDYCYKLTKSIKSLLININGALNNKLNIVKIYDIQSIFTNKYNNLDITLEDLQANDADNMQILISLKEKISTLGLSTINILARKIDAFNDRYNITEKLKIGGGITLSTLACIYLLDNRWITVQNSSISDLPDNSLGLYRMANFVSKKIICPTAQSIKSFLGEKPEYDSTTHDLKNRNMLKPLGKIHHTFNQMYQDDSLKAILGATGTAGAYFYGNQIHELSFNVKKSLCNYWEYLKGYNLSVNQNTKFYIENKITLDDERLIGLDNQIKKLKDLSLYITEPDMFDRQGVNLGKGILLTGPSRCGKTLAARALSGTINKILEEKGSSKFFGFMEVNFREIAYRENGLKSLIEEARANAPCVLFIDELHNLPLQTSGYNSTLTDFLTGMSGINSENDAKHQVIILAATNKPENLDNALLQPGRFGTIIHFDKPHFKSRKKYFEVMFKQNIIDATKFNIELLAQQTEGCSYGDLEEILRDARFQASKQGKKLEQSYIEEKIYSHVHKLKPEIVLTKEEKQIVAAHQAGKAVISTLLKSNNKIVAITLKGIEHPLEEKMRWKGPIKQPDSYKYGALIRYNAHESLKFLNSTDLETEIKIYLAGHLAQKELLGSIAYNYQAEDKNQAITYIKTLLLEGSEEKSLSKQAKNKLKEKTQELLEDYTQEVSTLLKNHTSVLKNLFTRLKDNITLSGKEVEKIINNR